MFGWLEEPLFTHSDRNDAVNTMKKENLVQKLVIQPSKTLIAVFAHQVSLILVCKTRAVWLMVGSIALCR